jgi:PKD repeat protein
MAPGVDIYSTLAGNDSAYGNLSGTSMACPLAAGLGALLLSHNPYYGPDDLELLLKQTAINIDTLNPGFAGQLGVGRINALEAVKQLKPLLARFTSDITFVCTGREVQFTDQSTNSPTAWLWSFPGGTPSSSTQSNPLITYNTPGIYPVTLIATNAGGSDTLTVNNYITAGVPAAVISGSQTVYLGLGATLRIDFQGTPPFSFFYTAGTTLYAVSNINTSTYYLTVHPTTNTTYALTSYTTRDCPGVVSGSAQVLIDWIPITSICTGKLPG